MPFLTKTEPKEQRDPQGLEELLVLSTISMARGSAALPAAALASWPALVQKGRGIREERRRLGIPELLNYFLKS